MFAATDLVGVDRYWWRHDQYCPAYSHDPPSGFFIHSDSSLLQ